jgi:hypothetical protein
MMFGTYANVASFEKREAARNAATTPKRIKELPGLPTVAESLPGRARQFASLCRQTPRRRCRSSPYG